MSIADSIVASVVASKASMFERVVVPKLSSKIVTAPKANFPEAPTARVSVVVSKVRAESPSSVPSPVHTPI